MNKKITFVVLAYNHEDYIEECLESIERQTIEVHQLIISNDASKDGTKNKINSFIITSRISEIIFLDHSENIGIIKSINACLNAATGEFIFLQAGDDTSHLNRAEITKMHFLKTECNVIYSSYQIMDKDSNIFKTKIRNSEIKDPTYFVLKGAAIPSYGAAFTRNFLIQLGPISEKLKNEDDYFGMAAVVYGGLLVIPDILYKYRIHSRSISSWNNMKIDSNIFLENYFRDQPNRVENYLAWSSMVEIHFADEEYNTSMNRKEKILQLINKKINIKKCIMNLDASSFLRRVSVLKSNIAAANLQDVVILTMGSSGILLIKWLRRKILRVV
jgi:alpha-1,3-rhamnosyltransferase